VVIVASGAIFSPSAAKAFIESMAINNIMNIKIKESFFINAPLFL
jgi:hypothetical protein